jgi:hypothetical protein
MAAVASPPLCNTPHPNDHKSAMQRHGGALTDWHIQLEKVPELNRVHDKYDLDALRNEESAPRPHNGNKGLVITQQVSINNNCQINHTPAMHIFTNHVCWSHITTTGDGRAIYSCSIRATSRTYA